RICPLSGANAAALRSALPFSAPRTLGVRPCVGLGDRLGLATPGHVRAVRGTGFSPLFAQQSIREMTRTNRTPRDVLDASTFGVVEAGWREGFGADGDHLKDPADAARCAEAGFTFFTIDPSDHVDSAADKDPPAALEAKFAKLPWMELRSSPSACKAAYSNKDFDLGDSRVWVSASALLRAAAKYGRAIAHVLKMRAAISQAAKGRPFELEMSVDETPTLTTPAELLYVASELRRLGVAVASLAPRFIGDFEKGVDYKGDLAAFDHDFSVHAAIARFFGPCKIGIHSGSDKFSIYPAAAKHSKRLIHLKTAGTSWLEALRAIATAAPSLFREIAAYALGRYEDDRKSYHVTGEVSKVPALAGVKDADLPNLLDLHDPRQILHVTYGSILNAKDATGKPLFRDRLMAALRAGEATHYAVLEKHLKRHLAPFGTA
ncbi:MAG: tagaturonate epimerase family protein, partial [Planctomycetota bacterium]